MSNPKPDQRIFMNHETRNTAFYHVLRPSGGEKCRLAVRVSPLCYAEFSWA